MHKVITVHLTGHADPYRLQEDAYDELSRYLDRARSRLADDPDQAEVMSDLERSIGVRFADRLGPDDRSLTAEDVAVVLDEVGPVGADDEQSATMGATRPRRRRLYRVREGQQVAGVCTGIAAYSEISLDSDPDDLRPACARHGWPVRARLLRHRVRPSGRPDT